MSISHLPALYPSNPRSRVNLELERYNRASRDFPSIDKDRVFVYKAADFTEPCKQIERLSGHFLTFRHMTGMEPAQAEELYNQLCAEPDIQTALERMRKKN